MSSQLIADSIAAVSSEIRVWPQDVILYEPPIEQYLLTDLAASKVTKGLLRLHGLSCETEVRHNAEFMVASGKTPFLKVGKMVIERDGILKYLQMKGYSFIREFPDELKLKAFGYLAYIEEIITPVELYCTWILQENLAQTKCKYSHGQPHILKHLLFSRKCSNVKQQLSALSWYAKSVTQVEKSLQEFCTVFTERLNSSKFLFGDNPCEVDVVLAAHLKAALEYKQPNSIYAGTIQKFPALVNYSKQFVLEG